MIAAVIEVGVLHWTAATGVAPYYPRAYDQVEYLTESYLAYQTLRDHGVVAGLAQTLVEPRVQGWLLQLEAGMLFLLTGPSRLAALDLNIAHLVALLVIAGTMVRRACGVGPALAFVALIVGAANATQLVGGVFDFRLDFAAMCLWGMLVGVLALSDSTRLARWPYVTVLIILGELFIAVRTLGFVYLVGLTVILLLATARHVAARRALLIALGIWSATEAAFVGQNWQLVRDYYIGKHLFSTEGDLRASAAGVGDLVSQVTFYPRSILVDQFGPVGELLLAGILAAALLLTVGSLLARGRAVVGSTEARPQWSFLVLIGAVAVPLAALTLDRDKSGVVGGILLPPLALLAVVGLGVANAKIRAVWIRRLVVVLGTVCLTAAIAAQALGLRRGGAEFSADSDAARASRFILTLGDWVAEQRGGQAVWSMDAHLDFGSVQVTRVYYYEQRRVWLSLTAGIGEGNIGSSLSPDEVRGQALPSDVLIMTQRTSAPTPPYPYDLSIEAARSGLAALAADQFQLAVQDEFFGRRALGYIRSGTLVAP